MEVLVDTCFIISVCSESTWNPRNVISRLPNFRWISQAKQESEERGLMKEQIQNFLKLGSFNIYVPDFVLKEVQKIMKSFVSAGFFFYFFRRVKQKLDDGKS
eukprot:GHVP01001456.1.p1 GENE.GHVP01001456.1~~GHVP01001456.1.p1  ORF type:complete len:102 (+),score=13.36 GHVP01001456.1:11-316(+)